MDSIPRLIGVIHLAALPSSPRFGGSLARVVDRAAADAVALEQAAFPAVIVENFGDAPFLPGAVDPATVACMTTCVLAVKRAAPKLCLGINVLRNDAAAALAVALACGAEMVRVNVHSGARVTDQGIVQGQAHHTLRLRRELALESVRLLCDVAVKHSAPLGDRPLDEEARDVAERGLADAVLLTGSATGRPVRPGDLLAVVQSVQVPVLVASGATLRDMKLLHTCHGVIVGSALRKSGRAGEPIDPGCAKAFADAFLGAT
jgi:membrane complex biogenesis BtpA family protein